MKALQTQFDNRRLASAVATPTCSSCCCCCCCLATSVSASSLLAQRIAKEGEAHQVPERHLFTTLAALFVPIVAALVYFGAWAINTLLRNCQSRGYEFYGSLGGERYQVCTNPGVTAVIPLLIVVPFLVLWFLYGRVHMPKPGRRAFLVTLLIAVAFIAEFFGGAVLILTGVGGIVYLCLVPIIIGWISVWYHRHLGRDMPMTKSQSIPTVPQAQVLASSSPLGSSAGTDVPVFPNAASPNQNLTEPHDDTTPQPTPPTASPQ